MPPASDSNTLSVSIWRSSRPRAGAERRAKAQLALPHRAAREQQVGDIDAGDQQHEQHRAAEHVQGRANLIDGLLVNRHQRDRPVGVALRHLLFELRHDRAHLAVGLLERHAVAQPRNAVRRAAAREQCAAVRSSSRTESCKRRGRPSIVKPGGITPMTVRGRWFMVSVHAEHVASAAEPRLPELVADHHHAFVALARSSSGV